jgi:hypothetical protein
MRTKPIKVFEKFVVVEGSGEFPIDMLRYDSAFPMTEQDSGIAANQRGRRRIALILRGVNDLGPTSPRWQSFTWTVLGTFRERFEAACCRDKSP